MKARYEIIKSETYSVGRNLVGLD